MILREGAAAPWQLCLLLVGGLVWPGPALRVLAEEPSNQTTGSRADDARRQMILASDAWRRTMGGLDEWFSTQTIYAAEQIEQQKRKLLARAQKMPADELEAFQRDLDAKLEMALGPEGRGILAWVEANLAAAAPAYRKQLGIEPPDLLHLTAAQFREQLDTLERKRSAARDQSAAFEHARDARIAALQAEQRQQFDERQRALDRAAASHNSNAYQSPYHPGGVRKYSSEYIRMPFYGWGWGFGFW